MIFNLFKSKPTLKELIPEGFTDIHSHIIPAVDDGAKNIKESTLMISKMRKLGFKKIIATPHTYPGLYNNSNEVIKNSFNNLINFKDHKISLSFASEYMIDNSLIRKSEKKNLLCLKENYILLEMSFLNPPINLFDILFKLNLNGYQIILAHPERYLFYENDYKKFYKLKNYGVKFQINFLSLIGYYGNSVVKLSERLINDNLIDFIGSDFHNISQIKLVDKKIKIREYKSISNMISNNKFFE